MTSHAYRYGRAKALIAKRNTHGTIQELETIIEHPSMIKNLNDSAFDKGRLPRAKHINQIADHLDGVEPWELVLAFAHDAGVRMPIDPLAEDARRIAIQLAKYTDTDRQDVARILRYAERMLRA